MKRRTERIARHTAALAIAAGLLIAFAGVALAQVVTSSPTQHGGPTMSSTTGGTPTNAKKVLVCHFTHSKKHPAHTISVAKFAEQQFLARGDHEGKCTDADLHPTTTTTTTSKHKSKSHSASKPDTHTPTGSTTSTATTTSHGNGGDHGDANGNGRGKGK